LLLIINCSVRSSACCLEGATMLPRRHEQRKISRQPMRRAAAVIFGAHEPPVHCVIWDMSDGGARLAVAQPAKDLPRTFTLVLSKGAVERSCEVVWTDARFVGVRFIRAVP
jgi:hypothetical protein